LCYLQHKLIGFYNRDGKCLQRGTDWGFKRALLGETKRIIKKMEKVTVGDFAVRKLENPHILRTPIFQRPN
jgi:hypothetical protein